MATLLTIILNTIILTLSSTLATASNAGGAEDKNGERWAVVELSAIYMRTSPDYESALETQELMGQVVKIVSEKGYWREIESPQPYRAWCTEKGLVEMSRKEMEDYMNAPKCIFTGQYGHVHERASDKSPVICDLVGGDIMRTAGRKGKWLKVMLPSGKEGWVQKRQAREYDGFTSISQGTGNADSVSDNTMEDIIAEAMKLKGVPYLWGGMTSKGVDCSGLVRICYLLNGILLPRNASQQIHCGDSVEMVPGKYPEDLKKDMEERVKNLKRGDLVFFGRPDDSGMKMVVTHVGIYLGGNRIIHSSHLVRINSLIPGDEDYYENAHRLFAARRL